MARTPNGRVKRGRQAQTRGGADRSGQVQSLVRAISLMRAIADLDDGATLTDLAQTVGLAPSTAHRLLTTLEQERFVRFDQERSLWLIGVDAFTVGNAFVRSRDLVSIARPYMRQLMEDSGETVNLAIEDQSEAIYLSQVECRQLMRVFARPGGRVPMHCSGVGKALMASMSEGEVSRILQKRGMARATGRSIDSPASLREALNDIQSLGYAFDDEEHAIGLRCVAAAILDEYGGPLAAISLSGPKARIDNSRVAVLGGLVHRAADQITAELGGAPPLVRAATS